VQSNRVNWYKHGLDIAIDVAQALHFLHCRNIIHFDCKSPNILLSATNSAKLAGARGARAPGGAGHTSLHASSCDVS
jgi:hypothetical protein